MKFDNFLNEIRYKNMIQLYIEFDRICFQYKINLKKPLIVIDDLKSSWGHWDPIRKIITLSSQLVKDYSWDIVIGILKHEIAHLIVTEVFFASDIHGESFKKACDLIGVPKEYCKANLSLENKLIHWKQEENQNDDITILRKVEKLLSLAQSANEHEALLAMEKVQDLYAKYNIKRLQEGTESQFYSLVINFKKKTTPSTFLHIASLIQGHYFVNVIFSELYDPLCDESHKTIEILGTRHNVLMAEFVFYFLKERIDTLWVNYQKEKFIQGRYKLSYQKGILVGFQSKLNNIKKEREKNIINNNMKEVESIHSLIKIEDTKLNEFTKKMFPRLCKKDSSSSRVYSEHYDEGKTEGKKITLNKPMSTSKKQNEFLVQSK